VVVRCQSSKPADTFVAAGATPKRGGASSDVTEYPRLIDLLCRAVTACETTLLRRGWRLPFGGSVIAIATKGGPARG